MAVDLVLLVKSRLWEANYSSATAPERPTQMSRTLAKGPAVPSSSQFGPVCFVDVADSTDSCWGFEWRRTLGRLPFGAVVRGRIVVPKGFTLAWSLSSFRRCAGVVSIVFHRVRHPTWRFRSSTGTRTSGVRILTTAHVMTRVVKCLRVGASSVVFPHETWQHTCCWDRQVRVARAMTTRTPKTLMPLRRRLWRPSPTAWTPTDGTEPLRGIGLDLEAQARR